jgi:hypothetical protein
MWFVAYRATLMALAREQSYQDNRGRVNENAG